MRSRRLQRSRRLRRRRATSVCEKGETPRGATNTEGTSPTQKEKGDAEALQNVLEEAGKMLCSLTVTPPKKTGREARLEDIQKQLDDMKLRKFEEVKVSKISKINFQNERGLLDSGATHAMRGLQEGEELEDLEVIQVELAGGQKQELRMTKGKVIVHDDPQVQPIVPLGLMVNKLGCEIKWSVMGSCKVRHPALGDIPVWMNAGCPEIDRELALCFIDMLEQTEISGARVRLARHEETELSGLAEKEKVFWGVPEKIMEKVIEKPADNLRGIPLNRSRRRTLEKGFVLHLYAGEKDGYTLQRALKEVGGDTTRLVEVDLKRGREHDMIDGPLYASLLRAAMDSYILGVVGGPNCRTRSVLRHYPLPAGRPRPVKALTPEDWFGLPGLDEEEKKQVWEDDVLLYRMIMIFCVAEAARRENSRKGSTRARVTFLLEQPEAPDYMPECGSWWRTDNYRNFRDQMVSRSIASDRGTTAGWQ